MKTANKQSFCIEAKAHYTGIFAYSTVFSQAWVRQVEGVLFVNAVSSARSIDEDRPRNFDETYSCFSSPSSVAVAPSLTRVSSTPLDMAKPVQFDISPSGQRKIRLRNLMYDDKGSKVEKPHLEVDHEHGTYRIAVDHGKFPGAEWFAGKGCWSSDERFFAYVAAPKQTSTRKSSLYFGDEAAVATESAAATATDKGECFGKYDYVEDWGEQFTDVSSLELFVLDIEKQRVVHVPGVDTDMWTVGQPCFVPVKANSGGGDSGSSAQQQLQLVYTAWSNTPRRLGSIYCYQRLSSLFVVDLSSLLFIDHTHSTADAVSVRHVNLTGRVTATARSPRFNRSGSSMVFLGSTEPVMTHGVCSELFCMDGVEVETALMSLDSDEYVCRIRTVVEKVERITVEREGDMTAVISFPGLYLDSLPRQCFLMDDSTVVLSSMWGSREVLLTIRVDSNSSEAKARTSITQLHVPSLDAHSDDHKSVTLLDVNKDVLVCTVSSPASPQRLFVWQMGSSTPIYAAVRTNGVKMIQNQQKPAPLTHQIKGLQESGEKHGFVTKEFIHCTDGTTFQSFMLYPPNPDRVIVVPHGGPHSVTPMSFIPAYAFLAKSLNAAILHVNYRGSTGFGDACISSLAGNIGRNDVADLVTCVGDWEQNSSGTELINVDWKNVAIVGGSHGGFLAGHAIGQYPSLFKVAAVRNPVMNIPCMTGVSDIPDWCHVESLGLDGYDFKGPCKIASDSDLVRMRQCSPIAYVNNVKAPTLVCLGGSDRRVPPSQGIEYYHMLKSRGITTRLLYFPDDVHSIAKPASEAEHWLAISEWLYTHWSKN